MWKDFNGWIEVHIKLLISEDWKIENMSETFSNDVLRNCTLNVFSQYPDLTVQNRSEAWLENSSFLDILGEIYAQQVDTKMKVSLKWVNSSYWK